MGLVHAMRSNGPLPQVCAFFRNWASNLTTLQSMQKMLPCSMIKLRLMVIFTICKKMWVKWRPGHLQTSASFIIVWYKQAPNQIQLDFDKWCKEAEVRPTNKFTEIRKQLDHQWKQIDKFEGSVKTYVEMMSNWRHMFSAKYGQLDAMMVQLK